MKNYSPLLTSVICSILFFIIYFFIDKNYTWVNYKFSYFMVAFPFHVFLVSHFILEFSIYLTKIKRHKENLNQFLGLLVLSTLTISFFYCSTYIGGLFLACVLFLRYSWGNWHILRSEIMTFSGKQLLNIDLFQPFIFKWVFFCFIGIYISYPTYIFKDFYFLKTIQIIFFSFLPFYLCVWIYRRRVNFLGSSFPIKLNFIYFVCLIYGMSVISAVKEAWLLFELGFTSIHVLEYYFVSVEKSFRRITNRGKNKSIFQTLLSKDLKILYFILIFNILYFGIGLYGINSQALIPHPEIHGGTTQILKWEQGSLFYFIFYDARTYHMWSLLHLSHGILKDKKLFKGIYNAFKIKKENVLKPVRV